MKTHPSFFINNLRLTKLRILYWLINWILIIQCMDYTYVLQFRLHPWRMWERMTPSPQPEQAKASFVIQAMSYKTCGLTDNHSYRDDWHQIITYELSSMIIWKPLVYHHGLWAVSGILPTLWQQVIRSYCCFQVVLATHEHRGTPLNQGVRATLRNPCPGLPRWGRPEIKEKLTSSVTKAIPSTPGRLDTA